MKDLFKLAIAFEKASQLASVDPNRVGPNSTPDPRMQKDPFSHITDPAQKPLADVLTHPATPGAIDPKIQSDLIDLGFPLPNRGPDGLLGPETKAALQAFKKKFNLLNASPDIVYKNIKDEAAKLNGANLSFKLPESAAPAGKAAPNTGDLIKDLNDHSDFIGSGPKPQSWVTR